MPLTGTEFPGLYALDTSEPLDARPDARQMHIKDAIPGHKGCGTSGGCFSFLSRSGRGSFQTQGYIGKFKQAARGGGHESVVAPGAITVGPFEYRVWIYPDLG